MNILEEIDKVVDEKQINSWGMPTKDGNSAVHKIVNKFAHQYKNGNQDSIQAALDELEELSNIPGFEEAWNPEVRNEVMDGVAGLPKGTLASLLRKVNRLK